MPASQNVRFKGALGAELAARLDLPASAPRAFALLAHCFTCSKDSLAASRISAALVAESFGVLRFDFTGLGDSDGEFSNTNFSSNVGDLLAAADWLGTHHGGPHVLIGHSLGGTAVLAAASRVSNAAAIVTIAAPFDVRHVRKLLGPAVEEVESAGEAPVDIGGRPFRIKKAFLDDLDRQDSHATIAALRKALLVFHSPRDTIVGIDNAAEIFAAAKHPKSFVSLDTADHLLSRREDAAYVASVLAAWARRYVATTETQAASSHQANEVQVVETRAARFTQDISIGRHFLKADEPIDVGGTDTGPSPYDFLLAALGACTNMTLRLYADHKGLPLERTTVHLQHRKIHAVDCAECETREGKVDLIERNITLEGSLNDEQRARLLAIADKCPVHRTLTSEIAIRTRLNRTS